MKTGCGWFCPGVLQHRSPGEMGTQYKILEALRLGCRLSVKGQMANILGLVSHIVYYNSSIL